jgi:hypothetical protein
VAQESPRRLLALIKGLPSDAAVWREDQPGWTRQDEWSALTIEALDHWGPLIFVALGGEASKLPSPVRLFEHPDRPGTGKPKPKGKPRLATPADLEAYAKQKEGGG